MNCSKVYFGFPRVTDPARHRDYNAWHQLDHLPENLALPGIVHGERWVRSPDCVAAEKVPDQSLVADSQYMALYWYSDLQADSVKRWAQLGEDTLQEGRRPELPWTSRPLMGSFRITRSYVHPRVQISVDAVPFRPHRGVYVRVSRIDQPQSAAAQELLAYHHQVHIPRVLELPGAVGAFSFRSQTLTSEADGPRVTVEGAPLRITLYYLDSDPVDFAHRLHAAEQTWAAGPEAGPESIGVEHILRSGPLRTIRPWEWDWFDDPAASHG